MSGAREAILSALGTDRPGDIAAEAAALLADPDAARPILPQATAVASFAERVTGPKVFASLDRVGRLDELPAAVARALDSRGLPHVIAVQPTAALRALDWGAFTLTDTVDEGVAIGLARWGIAETGSLVFHSAADMPILFNFLPALHIAALRASTVLGHLEDYAAAARAAGDPAPRNACLVTGASGTTDIEGSLVRGAHGPRELHIVLIDGE